MSLRSSIIARLCLALTVAAVLLFGLFGWRLVETERRQYRAAVEREVRLLGRSLQVSVENALRDGQLPDVVEVLDQLERVDPTVDVLVYDGGFALQATTRQGGSSPDLERLARRVAERGRAEVVIEDPGPPLRALFAAPVLDEGAAAEAGALRGALVLVRPLADLEADLAGTSREVVFIVGLFVAVNAAIALGLGRAYIRRPLRRLAGAMRAVRGGDLAGALRVERPDEIGAVAGEFNEMVADLRATRQRLDEESEARRRLEHGLREVDKLAAVGQLAAGLAHEIGSPLQVLTSRARGLQSAAERPDEVRRIGGILAAQTERITRVVQQLLTFTRRRPPRFDALDVRPAVGAVLDLLEVEGRRRGVAVRLEADRDLPPVRADADQVQQLVFNLVRNAVAATERGGRVTVALRRAEHRPDELDEAGPAVRIVVEDTGRGVPPELQARLFEAFVTTRADQGGTGLGLAVVRAIVEAHRGAIAFTSTPGRGARFDVLLPAVGPGPRSGAARRALEEVEA